MVTNVSNSTKESKLDGDQFLFDGFGWALESLHGNCDPITTKN